MVQVNFKMASADAPPFAVGDRVRVKDTHPRFPGLLGTVKNISWIDVDS